MPMEEFIKIGYGWVMRAAHVAYKRPLGFGDNFVVRIWIEEVFKDGVQVSFEILKKSNSKICSDGYFHFTMVNLETGRSQTIPEWILEKYSV